MTTIDDAIRLGRRIREGGTVKTDALPESSLAEAALAYAESVSAASLSSSVVARDAAESLLVVLGAIGATEAEARVAKRLAEVDETLLAAREAWGATAIAISDPWLVRIAALNPEAWWLDLVALATVRETAKLVGPLVAPPAVPERMRLRPRSSLAAERLHAEVVGMDDDPARVAIERGAVIARLFDGEVEVLAMGLRPDHDDLPAGLCVRRRGGGVDGITHVALGGAVGGKGHSGWWAPISHPGSLDLVVRIGDREESLGLEIDA